MEPAPDLEPEDIGPLLLPVLEYMDKQGLARLQIVAREEAPSGSVGMLHSPDDFECHEEPLAEGLRGVYAIADDEGEGRMEGPSVVPHAVLSPLLRRLDELHVRQLSIEALLSPSADSDGLNGVSMLATTTAVLEDPEPCDVDECTTHRPSDMGTSGTFITVAGDY